MHTTNLRKMGGSIMLAVPRVLLDILRLRPGTRVGIAVESGRLVSNRSSGPAIRWTNSSRNATPRQRTARKIVNGWTVRHRAANSFNEAR
jgi:antitoxin component of MazEF toxin-antitoxin module